MGKKGLHFDFGMYKRGSALFKAPAVLVFLERINQNKPEGGNGL